MAVSDEFEQIVGAPAVSDECHWFPPFAGWCARAGFHCGMQVPFSKALKEWETKSGVPAPEASEILLYGGMSQETKRLFINKLDGAINTLKECE